MLFVTLTVLVSICLVQSADIYGNEKNVREDEKIYVQDLINLPKPLSEDMMIQRCSKYLTVALNYLCPDIRRSADPSPGQGAGKMVLQIGKEVAKQGPREIGKEAAKEGTKQAWNYLTKTEAPKSASGSRQKRQLADECCTNQCTLGTLLQYCPQYD